MTVSEIGLIRLKNIIGNKERMTECQKVVLKRDISEVLDQYFFIDKGDVNVMIRKEVEGYSIIIDVKALDMRGYFSMPR